MYINRISRKKKKIRRLRTEYWEKLREGYAPNWWRTKGPLEPITVVLTEDATRIEKLLLPYMEQCFNGLRAIRERYEAVRYREISVETRDKLVEAIGEKAVNMVYVRSTTPAYEGVVINPAYKTSPFTSSEWISMGMPLYVSSPVPEKTVYVLSADIDWYHFEFEAKTSAEEHRGYYSRISTDGELADIERRLKALGASTWERRRHYDFWDDQEYKKLVEAKAGLTIEEQLDEMERPHFIDEFHYDPRQRGLRERVVHYLQIEQELLSAESSLPPVAISFFEDLLVEIKGNCDEAVWNLAVEWAYNTIDFGHEEAEQEAELSLVEAYPDANGFYENVGAHIFNNTDETDE